MVNMTKHSRFFLEFHFFFSKGVVMKSLTSMAQAVFSGVAPLESSSVIPILILFHQAWLCKDACFLLQTLIIKYSSCT